MQLEFLANELLLELFEFLDGVHLFQAFYGLNSRFNNLILLHCRNFYFNFRNVPKENFDTICQQILPLIFDRVISIQLFNDLETPKLPELFLCYGFTLNQFMHLKSLTLCSIKSLHTLIDITDQCKYFLNLIHFNMIDCAIDEFTRDAAHMFNNIWRLSKLTHCNFHGTRGMKIYLLEISEVSSSIKNLSIESCNLSCLFHLLRYTPNLRRLDAKVGQNDEHLRLKTIVSSLTSLESSFCGSDTALIDIFRCFPKLCHLTLDTSFILWTGYTWEKVLATYFPQLKVFQFKIEHYSLIEEKDIDKLLDSFRTPFWLEEHQWFVGCQWKPNNFNSPIKLYTLPYGFDYFFYCNDWCFKSTCLEEKDYYSFDRVRCFTYSFERTLPDDFHLRFPNISELHINFLCNPDSLSWFSSLNQLKSLYLSVKTGFNYRHLQALLDRAPCLYLLNLKIDCGLSKKLFQLTSSSVRRLGLLPLSKAAYFTTTDCINLISSPLGLQCEVLSIYVDNRMGVLNLIQQMSNLRSLRLQCNDVKQYSQGTDHKLVYWLHNHLSSTCLIHECQQGSHYIEVWINRQTKDTILSSEIQNEISSRLGSLKSFFKNLRRSN